MAHSGTNMTSGGGNPLEHTWPAAIHLDITAGWSNARPTTKTQRAHHLAQAGDMVMSPERCTMTAHDIRYSQAATSCHFQSSSVELETIINDMMVWGVQQVTEKWDPFASSATIPTVYSQKATGDYTALRSSWSGVGARTSG